MRVPFRSVLLLASFVFANSALGNADPITVIVTTVGTGTFNSQPFTNRLVTFTGSFTTEALDACESIPGGGNGSCGGETTHLLFSFDEPVTFTVNVAGFGTFDNDGLNYYLSVSPGVIDMGDVEDRLGLNVHDGPSGDYDLRHSVGPFSGPTIQDALGDNCENFGTLFMCPISASTTGGELILTSTAGTSTGEIQVGETSPIPEPGTLTLLGMGLLGVLGATRRKFFNA